MAKKLSKFFRIILFIVVFDVIALILISTIVYFYPEKELPANATSEKAIVKKITTGKIGFSIPDTMIVNKNYTSLATITASLNDSILVENIDSSNFPIDSTIEVIQVSPRMKVKLKDPTNENYKIEPLNTEEQVVSKSRNTVWRWNVKPIQSGDNPLELIATVIIKDEYGTGEQDVNVYDRTIFIKATPFKKTLEFLSNNWQWIMSSIFIPLFVYWFKERRKGKNQNVQAKD